MKKHNDKTEGYIQLLQKKTETRTYKHNTQRQQPRRAPQASRRQILQNEVGTRVLLLGHGGPAAELHTDKPLIEPKTCNPTDKI